MTEHYANKTVLNKLVKIKPLQLLDHQICVMKILSVLHDSEVFVGVVNNVGTKVDPRMAVHIAIAYVEELNKNKKSIKYSIKTERTCMPVQTSQLTCTDQFNDHNYDCDSGLRLRSLYTCSITYIH